MKSTSLLLLIFNTFSLATQAQVFDYFNELNTQTPGCAVGVVRDGQLVYEGYFGQANLRYQVPVDNKTVFNVGSISKHFTAALALQAEAKGQLSLNDSLKKYYPEGPSWFADVRLHHLINHQSGLPDYLNDEKTRVELAKRLSKTPHLIEDLVVGKPIAREVSVRAVIDIMLEQPAPSFKPGENASYSNTGYLLLADILEKTTGVSFSELAQKQLFKPLKMSSTELMSLNSIEIPWSATGYEALPSAKKSYTQHSSTQNTPKQKPSAQNTSTQEAPTLAASTQKYRRKSANLVTQGAGGVLTTLPDFAKWISHLMNPKVEPLFWNKFLMPVQAPASSNSEPNFEDALFGNSLTLKHKFNPNKSPSKLYGVTYNNGLLIHLDENGFIFSHSGFSVDGMRSYFWVSPAHKMGYIQLCNFDYDKKPTVKQIVQAYGSQLPKTLP